MLEAQVMRLFMGAMLALLDRIWLLACVLAAGCLPGFILQYRQRLAGRLDQVRDDLGLWQGIADRWHGGSLDALIAHHRRSADPTFIEEADAIESLRADSQNLAESVQALQGDLFQQLIGFLQHMRLSDVEATWVLYQPTFPLEPQGLLFALALGVFVWAIGALPVAIIYQRVARPSPLRVAEVDSLNRD